MTDAPLVGYAVTAKIRARVPRDPAVTATRRQMWEHILGEASGVRGRGSLYGAKPVAPRASLTPDA